MKKLVDLVFSDLFLEDPIETSWYKETPDSLITQAIPSDYMEEIYGLREKLSSHQGNPDFKVEWPNKSGFRMRVSRNDVSDSKIVFVCRRYRLMPGKLKDLGVPDAIAEQLLLPSLTKGLVIFLGKAGSGKTTTASSFIKEKLTLQGGVCWTVENPIELPMQGMHGKGRCYQTEVDDDAKMGAAILRLYRSAPNIIFIGELRDGSEVREAITAATSGHLVVATFHSENLISGLGRLARMSGEGGASIALSDALKVAIHLDLSESKARPLFGAFPDVAKGTGIPPRVLSVEPLWMTGEMSEALKSTIRDNDFHLLKSEIERQRRNFMNIALKKSVA